MTTNDAKQAPGEVYLANHEIKRDIDAALAALGEDGHGFMKAEHLREICLMFGVADWESMLVREIANHAQYDQRKREWVYDSPKGLWLEVDGKFPPNLEVFGCGYHQLSWMLVARLHLTVPDKHGRGSQHRANLDVLSAYYKGIDGGD